MRERAPCPDGSDGSGEGWDGAVPGSESERTGWKTTDPSDRLPAVLQATRSLVSVAAALSLQGCSQILSLDDYREAQPDGGMEEAGWCAVVRASDGTVRTSFCPAEGGARQVCRTTGLPCANADHDSAYHGDSGRMPWYQAAIDWASSNGASDVYLEGGVLSVGPDNLIPVEGKRPGGVGLRIPRGVSLHGSAEPEKPSVILASDGVSALALILVSGTSAAMTEVDHLTLVGTSIPGLAKAEDCPTQGLSMSSILEAPDPPTSLPTSTVPHSALGVLVDESPSGSGPVDLHHLRIAHVATGIQYGWETTDEPEDLGCETNPCTTLSFAPASGACQAGEYALTLRLPGETSALAYCVGLHPVADCTPTYCTNVAHEFLGNPTARSTVSNNAICDTVAGINIVGGQIDVRHNVVLRAFGGPHGAGLSVGGRLPHSKNTSWTENYVYGFALGFSGDGRRYVSVSDASFLRMTGYDRSVFADPRDAVALQRIILDLASEDCLGTNPEDGFIDHVQLHNNRLVAAAGGMGVAFRRANFAWVGFNVIGGIDGASASTGVLLDDTMNSWVYGNTIRNANHGIAVSGAPGKRSKSGSCWNGIGTNWNEVTKEFSTHPNEFLNTPCTVHYGVNYCSESPAPEEVCEH